MPRLTVNQSTLLSVVIYGTVLHNTTVVSYNYLLTIGKLMSQHINDRTLLISAMYFPSCSLRCMNKLLIEFLHRGLPVSMDHESTMIYDCLIIPKFNQTLSLSLKHAKIIKSGTYIQIRSQLCLQIHAIVRLFLDIIGLYFVFLTSYQDPSGSQAAHQNNSVAAVRCATQFLWDIVDLLECGFLILSLSLLVLFL